MDSPRSWFRVVIACCAFAAAGASATAGAAAAPAGSELDEVAVVGKSLRKLQREAIAAEDRFYKRFNQLNTRDDFDIRCEMEKATGTLVPQRQCRIQFMTETGALDGQSFYRRLVTESAPSGVNTPLATLWPEWELRKDEYQRTVRELVEQDAGLRALAAEWGQLLLQLEQRQKQGTEER